MEENDAMDMQELKSRLDKACNAVKPSDIILRIQDASRAHAKHVLATYHPFVAQCEAYYDLLVRAVSEVNYVKKDEWPPHRSLQCVLLVNNLKPIYSSFDRIIRGFYEDSMALTRVAYEAFWRIVFLSLHPMDPHWSFGPRKEGVTQFQLSNLVKRTLKLDWPHYDIMSSIAHANEVFFLKEMVGIARDGQKEPLGLAFGFDEFRFSLAVNLVQFVMLLYLKTVKDVFLCSHTSAEGSPIIESCDEYIYLMEQVFLTHDTQSWHGDVADVRDIFAMLRRVDSGEPFAQVWQEIRSPIG